ASGKVSPEDGVRLLNALTANSPGRKRPLLDLPQINVPKIDLGPLGDLAVELKNTVVSTAKEAGVRLHGSKAGAYLEPKKYDFAGPSAEGVKQCEVRLEVSAGKLKLAAGDADSALFSGKSVRV